MMDLVVGHLAEGAELGGFSLALLHAGKALFAATDENGLAGGETVGEDEGQFHLVVVQAALVHMADIVAAEQALGLRVSFECAVVLVLEELLEERIGEAFELGQGLEAHGLRLHVGAEVVSHADEGEEGKDGHSLGHLGAAHAGQIHCGKRIVFMRVLTCIMDCGRTSVRRHQSK